MGFWEWLFGKALTSVSTDTTSPTTVPCEFEIVGYTALIYEQDTGEQSIALSEDRADDEYAYLVGPRASGTPEEIDTFMRFYLMAPTCHLMLTKKRFGAINIAFQSWRESNGPRDKNGRLKNSMRCIGFNQGYERCANMTKSSSGLCRHHSKPGASNMWNCEWYSESEEDKRRHEEAIEARIQWEEKWRPIASNLRYTATDRQVFYLLELGVAPNEINGITKREASVRISAILDRTAGH